MQRLNFGNNICLWVFPGDGKAPDAEQRKAQAAKGGAVLSAKTRADMAARGETMAERIKRLRREAARRGT